MSQTLSIGSTYPGWDPPRFLLCNAYPKHEKNIPVSVSSDPVIYLPPWSLIISSAQLFTLPGIFLGKFEVCFIPILGLISSQPCVGDPSPQTSSSSSFFFKLCFLLNAGPDFFSAEIVEGEKARVMMT